MQISNATFMQNQIGVDSEELSAIAQELQDATGEIAVVK
jgi:uncharacterized protein YukE